MKLKLCEIYKINEKFEKWVKEVDFPQNYDAFLIFLENSGLLKVKKCKEFCNK